MDDARWYRLEMFAVAGGMIILAVGTVLYFGGVFGPLG